MGISLRFDSAALLDPYIDEIGALLQRSDEGSRKGAIFLLAQGLPTPSPKAMTLLKTHMHAANTDPREVGGVASVLLHRQGPQTDPAVVHEILAVVRARNDPGLTASVLSQFGNFRVTTAEALRFIADGFKNPDSGVRRDAVDAVGMFDAGTRAGFTQALQAIAHNPAELPDIRKIAEGVLARAGG